MIDFVSNFVKRVSPKIVSALEDYCKHLGAGGVYIFSLGKSYMMNMGEYSFIVDYSYITTGDVDAYTIECILQKFGNPSSYVLAVFAKSFAESAFKFASRNPVALFVVGGLRYFCNSSTLYKVSDLVSFLKDKKINFININSYNDLLDKNSKFLELSTALSWLASQEELLNPEFLLDLLIEKFSDESFWNQYEICMYDDLARALSFVGFDVHNNKGGQYADLYILRPLKIVVEIKNERATKDAIEQVINYSKSITEIDKYLRIKIKGPWFPMVIAPDFSNKAVDLAVKKKIILLDKDSLILFLRYFSIFPPNRFSILDLYSSSGIIKDVLKHKLEDVLRKYKTARKILEYLQSNPRPDRLQLEVVASSLGLSYEELYEFLKAMKIILPLIEERHVIVPANFKLIHFIKLYKILAGGKNDVISV